MKSGAMRPSRACGCTTARTMSVFPCVWPYSDNAPADAPRIPDPRIPETNARLFTLHAVTMVVMIFDCASNDIGHIFVLSHGRTSRAVGWGGRLTRKLTTSLASLRLWLVLAALRPAPALHFGQPLRRPASAFPLANGQAFQHNDGFRDLIAL